MSDAVTAAAIERFFADRPHARALFGALQKAVAMTGATHLAATKSRVAFVRHTRYLWVHEAGLEAIWIGFKLDHPLPKGARPTLRSGAVGKKWSHHLKLTSPADIDAQLRGWLQEAWEADG